MTGTELSEALRKLGWGANDLARILDVSRHNVRRWLGGTRPIPDNLAVWISELAANNGNGPELPDGWR